MSNAIVFLLKLKAFDLEIKVTPFFYLLLPKYKVHDGLFKKWYLSWLCLHIKIDNNV